MKKIQKYVLAFVSSKNSYESVKYANKLMMTSIVPLLVLASVINIVLFGLFTDMDLPNMLVNSSVMLLMAGVFLLVDRFIKSELVKYDLYNIIFCAILVFTVLRYYAYSGPAVWTIAFVIILLSILRNNKRMIVSISVTVFCLGTYVWAANLHYIFGLLYTITQFVVFAIVFIVGAGVLKINVERYKKTSHFLNESDMFAQISSAFISVNVDNIGEKVEFMLEKSTKYYGVERSTILLLSKDEQKLIYTYEWQVEGIEHASKKNQALDMVPMWKNRFEDKTVWFLSNVDKMSDSMGEKAALQKLNIKSVISMPIIANDKVFGIMFLESFTKYVDWKDEHSELLVLLTHLLADAFLKVEAEKEINYLAYFDTLTGLPNRVHFNQQVDQAIEAARKYDKSLAVMFIDLDSFKSVNDMIGHEGGDELLRQVGVNLREQVGNHGLVGRLGGDEFIVLIPDLSITDNIEAFTDHVMNVFRQPVSIDNQEFFMTASAGVAVYPKDGYDCSTLRKNADLAMYTAKELGKNQAVFCTPKLKEDIEKKVRITNLLHRAQEKNELVIYYQPLIDIATKEIVGAEALLRWMQPELGMVPPGVFIPMAEQTGLIFPIGKWALKEACRQNKAWQDAGYKPIRMAVNLSIEQFRRADITDMIKEALDESGLDPKYLELEITESVAIKETTYICGILTAIRDLGVSISIDDFGTEYSSLARIKRLPIDRIKMAMEFVHGISVSDKDEAIAKIIINLARNLGLKVIAEGVETQGQFEFLKDRVCDEVQGYYFYKPMTASDAEKILEKPDPELVCSAFLTV